MLLGLTLFAYRPRESSAQSLPPAFAAWAESLEEFTTLQMAISLNYPPDRSPCRAWLYASATQTKASIDWVTCASIKYSWNGREVRLNQLVNGQTLKPTDLGPFVTALWGELRAGFANSTVVSVNQDRLGLHGYRGEWSRVTLPFSWAEPYTVYVDISRARLAILQVFKGTKLVLDLTVNDLTVNESISAAHLGPYASAGERPYTPNWGHDVGG